MLTQEFHPFSKYPMYSSFPNYSYSFYVADGKDSLLPFMQNFKVQANEIGHIYVEICEEHQFKHGFGMETDSQLRIVGQELLGTIIKARKMTLSTDSVSIHRKYYFFEGGKIKNHDEQLCKRKVE
jgi:hypothetical protein